MKKVSPKQTSLIILVVILVGVLVGYLLSATASRRSNHSDVSVGYLLPYTSTTIPLKTLPKQNEVTIKTDRDIHVTLRLAQPTGDFNTTEGTLTVEKNDSQTTRTIDLVVTADTLAKTLHGTGLKVDIGNQYDTDNRIGIKGKLSPGPYKLSVYVKNTTGDSILTYTKTITL